VIVGIGGRATPDIGVLENTLIGYRPGERATVEVLRNGNPRQVSVKLGSLGS